MWSPGSEYLDPSHASSVFLLALWRELFDPLTPDTYQPRLHNVPSLIEELGGACSRAGESTVWLKHVKRIRDELRKAAQEEQDLITHLPEYQWQVERIGKARNSREIELACRLLIQRRGEYDHVLFDSIERSIQVLPQKKEAAYTALRRLATIAVQASRDDADVLNDIPSPSATPEAVLQSLMQLAAKSSAKYRCVFVIVGEQSDIQRIVRPVGFQLIRGTELPRADFEKLCTAHDRLHFVETEVDAKSTRDAIAKARHSLSIGVDVFNLYSNSAALQIIDGVFLKRSDQVSFTAIYHEDLAFRRLHPRSRAAQDSLGTVEMVSQNRLEDRVLSALELHSLAMASSEPRVKLVNLWSALECLAGCCEEKSAIGRVINLVVPLLVWRRVDKVVRYTAIGIQEFGNIESSHAFGSGFVRSHAAFVHPWDTMLTLCRPENHRDILELLAFAGRHSFFVYRLFRLWEQFHDPATLHKSLLASRDRVEWQLWRIYRARNLLVHDGEESPALAVLLDNLHYYASIVIQRIIHGMKIDPSWGVREAIEYWNVKSHFILESLEKRPGILRVSDFFPLRASNDSPHLWL